MNTATGDVTLIPTLPKVNMSTIVSENGEFALFMPSQVGDTNMYLWRRSTGIVAPAPVASRCGPGLVNTICTLQMLSDDGATLVTTVYDGSSTGPTNWYLQRTSIPAGVTTTLLTFKQFSLSGIAWIGSTANGRYAVIRANPSDGPLEYRIYDLSNVDPTVVIPAASFQYQSPVVGAVGTVLLGVRREILAAGGVTLGVRQHIEAFDWKTSRTSEIWSFDHKSELPFVARISNSGGRVVVNAPLDDPDFETGAGRGGTVFNVTPMA